MLRVYEIQNDERREVLLEDGVYNVQELGVYEMVFFPENNDDLNPNIEGTPLPSEYLRLDRTKIVLMPQRYFEDYFGGTQLTIGGKTYPFNVRISKLKLSEIEGLFTYLWQKEDRLFDVFYSKSSVEVKNKTNEVGQMNKFITLVTHFVTVFQKLLPYFEKQPHFVLRKKTTVLPFNSNKVSANTVQWIINNLDEVQFDDAFKGHHKAVQLGNHYGMIDNIHTEVETRDCNTYENQVVMGIFFVILKKLRSLKRDIELKSTVTNWSDTEEPEEHFVDFKDLKRLPFIRLFEEISKVEQQVKKLEQSYRRIFPEVTPKAERPVLTSIFIQRPHYKRAYELIRKLNDYKLDITGYFKLFNISKLSKLYELYNLFQLIDALRSSLKIAFFNVNVALRKEEPIVEKMEFTNDFFAVNLFYEHKYYPENSNYHSTLLRRIDCVTSEEYYHPDFIIEIIDKKTEETFYYLFDAKYSVLKNVKFLHLPSLEKKYIARTGISGERYKKINGLFALFPDEEGEKIVDNAFFEPQIALIASKPNTTQELKECVQKILKKHIGDYLLNSFE